MMAVNVAASFVLLSLPLFAGCEGHLGERKIDDDVPCANGNGGVKLYDHGHATSYAGMTLVMESFENGKGDEQNYVNPVGTHVPADVGVRVPTPDLTWEKPYGSVKHLRYDLAYRYHVQVERLIYRKRRVRKVTSAFEKVLRDPELEGHCLYAAMAYYADMPENLHTMMALRALVAEKWLTTNSCLGLTLQDIAAATMCSPQTIPPWGHAHPLGWVQRSSAPGRIFGPHSSHLGCYGCGADQCTQDWCSSC